MTAAGLLEELRSGGLVLELDDTGGRIAVSGGILTNGQRAAIRARRAELVRELHAERRRGAVLAILERDATLAHAWLAEPSGDCIVVAGAIRGVGTFELTIAADRYDAFAVAAALGLAELVLTRTDRGAPA